VEKAKLEIVYPVLPSRDVAASIEYYTTRLGFTLRFQDAPNEPRYAVLRRDAVVLHVQWHDPAEWAAVERPMLRFHVSSAAALFEEYRDKDVFHERTALRDTAWGTREFAFFDRDQNGLTFLEDLPAG
jgi:catechol 2,3-dioxygenase-like lactoylglutathione lyase family enzyme